MPTLHPRNYLRTSLVLLSFLAPSPPLLAQGGLAESWQQRAQRVDQLLIDGEWEAARELTQRLEVEISDLVVAGGKQPLGQLAVFRALAAAGLRQGHEALWFWKLSGQLFPEVERIDLSRYGDAGVFLLANPPQSREQEVARLDLADASEVEPPKRFHTTQPRFPQARYVPGRQVSIRVRTIVGTDGIPRSPEVVEASGEWTMVYSALAALQQWRFEPALRDGEPVAVLHELSVTFQVPE